MRMVHQEQTAAVMPKFCVCMAVSLSSLSVYPPYISNTLNPPSSDPLGLKEQSFWRGRTPSLFYQSCTRGAELRKSLPRPPPQRTSLLHHKDTDNVTVQDTWQPGLCCTWFSFRMDNACSQLSFVPCSWSLGYAR